MHVLSLIDGQSSIRMDGYDRRKKDMPAKTRDECKDSVGINWMKIGGDHVRWKRLERLSACIGMNN